MRDAILVALCAALAVGVAGCGGVSDAPTEPDPPIVLPDPNAVPDPLGFLKHWNVCAQPRAGSNRSGQPYPDTQGTLADEMAFLDVWLRESYLWPEELPWALHPEWFVKAVDYFHFLKTPALTASGRPKDRYHFSYPTEQWDALSSTGSSLGYGITWSRREQAGQRIWRAAMVEPGTPAAQAGLRRGDQLLTIDDHDFVRGAGEEALARINAALAPQAQGETHRFGVMRDAAVLHVTLGAAKVVADPVRNARTFATPTGTVGYLTFNSHNAAAEIELIDAIAEFKREQIADLVLDLRYNGGGFLLVASELAYMIAGPEPTAGKVFEQARHNRYRKPSTPIPFRSTVIGYKPPPRPDLAGGQPLPYLGLKRVTILAGAGTCSASESVINALRGVDVEVNLIGGTTCGKPYAFTPMPNCGTTYFAIQFQGVNDKGFGDYADGFAPTCEVADDLDHELGDPVEARLAAAMAYRASGACPAPAAARTMSGAGARSEMRIVRPEVSEIALYPVLR